MFDPVLLTSEPNNNRDAGRSAADRFLATLASLVVAREGRAIGKQRNGYSYCFERMDDALEFRDDLLREAGCQPFYSEIDVVTEGPRDRYMVGALYFVDVAISPAGEPVGPFEAPPGPHHCAACGWLLSGARAECDPCRELARMNHQDELRERGA